MIKNSWKKIIPLSMTIIMLFSWNCLCLGGEQPPEKALEILIKSFSEECQKMLVDAPEPETIKAETPEPETTKPEPPEPETTKLEPQESETANSETPEPETQDTGIGGQEDETEDDDLIDGGGERVITGDPVSEDGKSSNPTVEKEETPASEDSKLVATKQEKHVHNFATVIPKDDNKHQKVCACGEVVEENHQFEENWRNLGRRGHSRRCRLCGYEQTRPHELGKPTSDGDHHIKKCKKCCYEEKEKHHYRTWKRLDGNRHIHVCKDCMHKETKAHRFKWGKITGKNHIQECKDCKYKETKAHQFMWVKKTWNSHTQKCKTCRYEQTGSHVFSLKKVKGPFYHIHIATCGKCQYIRKTTYRYECVRLDNEYHIKRCNECHEVISREHHIWRNSGSARKIGGLLSQRPHCAQCDCIKPFS